ncbi:MAG TPA: hypothetical protein VFU36_00120, partial [Jatrophihabitans sp.]|nr:hypothetical protein [Jatrophihabitans sp.]
LSCLGPALDLQPDLINERLTALRELIALQRNRLPEERSPAFADHALTMLKRWQMFREEPVTRDDLPIALRDARFAVHNASPAKLADALQALMLVLAVIVDLEPSRPAAEELAQACRQLLDQDPDGSVRTTATKHLQAAERIAAEYPAVGLDQPEPTVDDLRARWQTATEDDRIEAAIRLANAILDLPPGAADMAELLALQEEICKRNPITADTRVLVYHFNRARALGMLGRADEAAGVFAEIAEQEVDVTFRLIACRTWIGVLRQHRVSEPEPWETLLRTVNAIAALVPAEHDVAIKNLLSEAGLADLTFRRRDDTSAIAPPVLADLFAYCEAARTAAPTSGSSDRADSLRRTAGLLIRLQPMERTAEWIRWVDLAREAVRLPGAFIDPYPSVLEILSDVLLAWWQAAPAERRDPALSAEALGYAFRAVEVARPDNRFGAIHSLVNALHVVGPPDKDLSLFIWAGTSLLRAKDYSLTDEQWIQIANMTTDALRRHAAFSSPLAEREDRELLCAVYRMAMARFAGGSPQHVSSAALLATEIANLPASTTLIDERIELLWYTYREAERADLNPNYVLLNLANTLSMRAGRSQDPAQRLANLREAWRVSADARDNATDPVERLTCTANWAGHALSLVTEGELGGNQTLREILSALRAVVGDVEPVEALWILRTLSPLVIEAMKREGIWPVMPEDSSVEV